MSAVVISPGPDPLTEAEMVVLVRLRERFEARLRWERDQVEELADTLYFYNMGSSSLAANLIEHAEEVCQTLAPFVKRREP